MDPMGLGCLFATHWLPSSANRHAHVSASMTIKCSLAIACRFHSLWLGKRLRPWTRRLSEEPNVTVLVIEGGNNDEHDPRVYDVRTYGEAFVSDLDYNLTSTPISWRNGTQLPMVAGKTLGGSGSINGASWTKGPKSQYDLLPVLTGDKSWGWEGLNEYMLGAENFNVPTPRRLPKARSGNRNTTATEAVLRYPGQPAWS
ncbi:hypothetical protein M8818_000354 [Zalaria obscura]|uniref:Uncharacterized protein n=1 Tax=Zalaria obscura TaxID=2024903 RepID=A0ACC3SMN6_9PEZI